MREGGTGGRQRYENIDIIRFSAEAFVRTFLEKMSCNQCLPGGGAQVQPATKDCPAYGLLGLSARRNWRESLWTLSQGHAADK